MSQKPHSDPKMSKPQTWLITGVGGFIGSNAATFLLDRGQRVVGLDDFSTGKREHIQRIKQKHTNNFVFFEGSILNEELLGACFRQADIIVHLAAQVSVASSVENPIVNNETNVTGFLRILEAAAKSEAHALIYASSCAVYGDSFELPLKESQVPNPLVNMLLVNW